VKVKKGMHCMKRKQMGAMPLIKTTEKRKKKERKKAENQHSLSSADVCRFTDAHYYCVFVEN
jgi:hypothetical protein